MKRDNLWLFIGLVALAIFGGGAAVYTMTRGLRNNNPGNIRLDGTRWLGMADTQTDGTFVQFVTPEYGIRAMSRILANYALRGLNTVRSIISTWAPPNENDTDAYIDAVSEQLNVGPDVPLAVDEWTPQLVAAIVKHENGINPYSDDVIARGVNLA